MFGETPRTVQRPADLHRKCGHPLFDVVNFCHKSSGKFFVAFGINSQSSYAVSQVVLRKKKKDSPNTTVRQKVFSFKRASYFVSMRVLILR